MNKEKIINTLSRISTPTGFTLYGDYTLNDYTRDEILDYINEQEKENTNLKQALNEIREVLKRFECSLWIETDALRKEVEKIIYEYTKED